MEDFMLGSREIDQSNQSGDSESEVCSSSCCSSDSEYIPWLEHVKNDGSLFYIETDSSTENLLEDSPHESHSPEQTQSQRSKSKFNPALKIKKWMKARKKKERKSFPLTDSSKSENNPYSFQNVDKFSQVQSKDIFVDVDPIKVVSCSNGKTSLAEMLLGLKLGPLEENYSANEKPCILAVRPTEEMPDVKIGDRVFSVNDINVNMSNLEDVLKGIPIPSKVKLTIMSSKSQDSSQIHLQRPKHYDLRNELLGESSAIQLVQSQYLPVPHGLFFLTIGNGTVENDDVLYRYPDDDTLLFQLKGMFLTLGHMISDVATPPLLSCSVMVLNELVHVGFVAEEDKIMVLAVPASVASVTEIQHFSTRLAKFLKYLFSSLQKAFTIGKSEDYLDNFFTLYFEHYLSPVYCSQSATPESHLIDILPSAHWFPLPNDIKTEIEDILSELESAEFEIDSDGFYKNRRLYNIYGSCLFYKGYLLCSHLPKNDLLDIHLVLYHNHLLELTHTQPDTNIIIWKEVFPSKRQECLINPDTEFEEFHGRWFLLIVAMHHSILAVLLDDGGCCIKHEENSPPESFYVEEVQNTLWILHDYGITSAVEKFLHNFLSHGMKCTLYGIPWHDPLLYIDMSQTYLAMFIKLHFSVFPPSSSNLLFKENSENSLASTFTSNTSIPSSGPNVSDHSTSHSSLTDRNLGHADGESDSESSYSNGSNEMTSIQKRYRSLSVSAGYLPKSEVRSEQVEYGMEKGEGGQNFSSLPNLYEPGFDSDNICFENSFRMVSSFGSNLFYYLHMDPVEGIFIAPIVPNSSSTESLQKSILSNFYKCCLRMRTVFERSLRNGEIIKANIVTKYGVNSFLQNAYEQGLLFKCDQVDLPKQKGSQNLSHFWVIGRLFFSPEPREVYICHHDGAAQDVVEMAFRLGFGLSF